MSLTTTTTHLAYWWDLETPDGGGLPLHEPARPRGGWDREDHDDEIARLGPPSHRGGPFPLKGPPRAPDHLPRPPPRLPRRVRAARAQSRCGAPCRPPKRRPLSPLALRGPLARACLVKRSATSAIVVAVRVRPSALNRKPHVRHAARRDATAPGSTSAIARCSPARASTEKAPTTEKKVCWTRAPCYNPLTMARTKDTPRHRAIRAFTIGPDVSQEIDKRAAELGIPRSRVADDALRRGLSLPDPNPEASNPKP